MKKGRSLQSGKSRDYELPAIVETFLREWKETRALTIDWINTYSIKILNQKLPRPGLDSFSKHIRELSEVEEAYTMAIETDNLDFSKITDGTDNFAAENKKILVNRLRNADKNFHRIANKITNWQEEIFIFGKRMPKFLIIELMIRHETFHHGQFIAFGFLLNTSFPQSWIETWALPTRPNKYGA